MIFLLSFFISALATFTIHRLGPKLFLIDTPNERSSHLQPTPRGGGIGIWLAFIITGILIAKELVFITIAAAIGLLGFFEDIYTFPARVRLMAQMLISLIGISFFLPYSIENILLLLFWLIFIVGTLNFYNFMDGINGIAALTGIVGFSLLALFSSLIVKDLYIFSMSVVLVFACLGFLPFNFPKAKVFMGDVGSIFLGFVFAFFVAKLSVSFSVFLCLVMFLFPFYADSITTIFYRWKRGENLIKAHRSHLYQYLSNELKLPHWQVSVGYALVQLIVGLMAIWAYQKNITWQIVLLVLYGTAFVFAYRLIKFKVTTKAF